MSTTHRKISITLYVPVSTIQPEYITNKDLFISRIKTNAKLGYLLDSVEGETLIIDYEDIEATTDERI